MKITQCQQACHVPKQAQMSTNNKRGWSNKQVIEAGTNMSGYKGERAQPPALRNVNVTKWYEGGSAGTRVTERNHQQEI